MDWKRADPPPALGEEHASLYAELLRQCDHLIATVRQELESRADESLEGQYGLSGQALGASKAEEQQIWIAEAQRLTGTSSPWFAAGLGKPGLLADYKYWGMSPFLTVPEIALLSMGLEPGTVLEHVITGQVEDDVQRPAEVFARRRLELVGRKFQPTLATRQTTLDEVAEWVELVALDCHPGFSQMLATRPRSETLKGTDVTNDKPEGRELASMSKLLTAIAISEYGYVPTDKRSPIPREIEEMTDLVGLSVSRDTIRKYLRMGSELLPHGWKPDSD